MTAAVFLITDLVYKSTVTAVVAGPGVERNARPTSTSPIGDRRENRRSPETLGDGNETSERRATR
jgi:hypothetical protein